MLRRFRIGKLKTIHVGCGGPPKPCNLAEGTAPDDVDWNMWVGPSAYRGYSEVLCPKGMHKHFPQFRVYREYAGGALADMGAHHFDIAQWAMEMDASGPTKIEPPNGDNPQSGLKFTYANGVEMIHGSKGGCTFEGTDGTIYVNRPVLESTPEDIVKTPLGEKERRVYTSNDHRRNWVDCVKSRKQPICPPEVGHRTASICHLANIGYWLKRPLNWDPAAEKFDDAEANKMLSRPPRDPWTYDIA